MNISNLKTKKVLAQVALKNGVTVGEVRTEIQNMIDTVMATSDPITLKKWEAMAKRGNVPTVEDVIENLTNEVLNHPKYYNN